MTSNGREFDVVVYGATGFVGKLVAQHLASHGPKSARIALAGRSEQKLRALRDTLPSRAREWPIIVADSFDRKALDAMVTRTRAVATTVGPYEKFGYDLVAACAHAGTHYADLTGEALFVRRCADEFDEQARKTGARIVNSCGFDSIPSDLGVLLCYEAAVAADAGKLTDTTLVVRSMKGGFSGGTVDSLRNQVDKMKADPSLKRVVADWYALSPDRSAEPAVKQPGDAPRPRQDAELGGWIGPFVMASFNTRLVRRSNALLDWEYGRDFRYQEVSFFGNGARAAAMANGMALGLGAMFYGMGFKPSRIALDRLLPKPGEGPSEEARTNGRFHMEIIAATTSGKTVTANVAAKGDPGYAATAVMLSESALCLALDTDALPKRAGVLTPASAMGDPLIARLRAAGFTADASVN